MMETRVLERFLDAERRVRTWPSRLKHRLLVMDYLATHFEPGKSYSEAEVNAILNRLHTFEDWAGLRRALFDHGFMDRLRDGSSYWRVIRPPHASKA